MTIFQKVLHILRLIIINIGVNVISFSHNVYSLTDRDNYYMKRFSSLINNSKSIIYSFIKFYYV